MVFHYHKPLTGMYGDNYRYGTSLYSSNANDVEKNYRSTLSKTHLRSDRGDLGLYTFAGSNLHGGTPASEKITAPKTTSRSVNHDLYAPLQAGGYGQGYYDHLRARTPEPRSRSRPIPESYTLSDEPDYKTGQVWVPSNYHTGASKISSDYDYDSDRNKTTTKTTKTTEYWVPLTTHIYNTPYHTYYYRATPHSSYTYRTADDLYSYNYVDDYKRYATTTSTTKSKNIDALDLSITSRNYEKANYSSYVEKCNEIQSKLDEVNKWVYEAENKMKSDVVSSRNKIESELAEIALVVEDTAKYSEDLHRVIRKQAKQISALSSQYNDVNRHLVDISDTIEKSRVRCQSLQSDLSSVQSGLELVGVHL